MDSDLPKAIIITQACHPFFARYSWKDGRPAIAPNAHPPNSRVTFDLGGPNAARSLLQVSVQFGFFHDEYYSLTVLANGITITTWSVNQKRLCSNGKRLMH
jgi:hypothetical protein